MGKVVWLQDPHHPHCPKCGHKLPTFDDMTMLMPPGVEIVSVTFRVRCQCDALLDLTKTVKR